MAKRIALIMALLLITVCVLAGCTTESYEKTPLTGDTSGEVVSNGGIAIAKGDYIYYVNGNPTSNKVDNIYGKPVLGSIVRISKFNLEQALMSSNTSEVINANTEIVVPKVIFTDDTTEKLINGIYIFNDRIYYITPDSTLDRDGAQRTTRSALKSCKLDGTDTIHHYIFSESQDRIILNQLGGKLFATVIADGNLYNMDLSQAEPNLVEIDTGLISVKFSDNGTVFYINKDYGISVYKIGEETAKEYVANPSIENDVTSTVTYTLKTVAGDNLYYQVSSTYQFTKEGIYRLNNGKNEKILTYIPNSMQAWGDKLVLIENSGLNIIIYNPNTKEIVNVCTAEKSSSMIKIVDSTLYLTSNNAVYQVELTEGAKMVKIANGSVASTWSTYDIADKYVFYMATTDIETELAIKVGAPGKDADINVTRR